ncbi:tRNA pseudouridine(38-40) synthase TruA [Corynebacterium sp. 13CS0277]|uniref:tRNA pseudouridine(38-40) synthase TruA n=1 Tax=Corynebacterium sp. 13CS0277 TaxID=2071994 RepID=UPI000D026677|nr:tRNA pseudouridine(38-40) synthase TruA [Corynebacterium sp. 13CS0277]PRQ11589.1 tRNA pseudouridine(38-40) synthase TruA [Corynebacterium sp. 13CS0277]
MTQPPEAPTSAPAAACGEESSPVLAPAGDAESRLRLKLGIAYDGTDFHGWAAQGASELRTVQKTIEDAFALITRVHCPLTVAGRTDAGVHAAGQVAHVDIPRAFLETRSVGGDVSNLVRRLARLLPQDVRITSVEEAAPGFDARFSALARTYHYRVTTAPAGPLPTRARDTAHWAKPIDVALLKQAAGQFVGLHDFAAVCKHKEGATTIRHLQAFDFADISTPLEPQLYQATVTADAFCWNMVRCLVGASLAVAEGRRPVDFPTQLLQETQRSPLVPLAPACGLSLVRVDYPADAELSARAQLTRAKRSAADLDVPGGQLM